MDSVLVVTVGTSLFTSASWRCEGPFATIPCYRTWREDQEEEPAKRRANAGSTAEDLQLRLEERNAEDVERYFDWNPHRALRYSAELATLLRWMEYEGRTDLGTFLSERYGRVELVCPANTEDPARIAADFLLAALHDRLGVSNVRITEALVGRSIRDQVRHFSEYLESLGTDTAVDLVVSGGYKAFAMYASLVAAAPGRRQKWQVLYIHEDSYTELIVQKLREGRLVVEVDREPIPRVGNAESL